MTKTNRHCDLQIRESTPYGTVVEFEHADRLRAELLTSYIDSWAWMDQNTLSDVFTLVAENTILNKDFASLVQRWFTGASLLIEPCLQMADNQQLISTVCLLLTIPMHSAAIEQLHAGHCRPGGASVRLDPYESPERALHRPQQLH